MEPQVITFHHFSFFFFSIFLWHHCCLVEIFLLGSCLAVSQFLCLRMLSEAITELYFSFYLSLFFFCPKEKFGQII